MSGSSPLRLRSQNSMSVCPVPGGWLVIFILQRNRKPAGAPQAPVAARAGPAFNRRATRRWKRGPSLPIAPLLRDPAPALQANLGQADLERRK